MALLSPPPPLPPFQQVASLAVAEGMNLRVLDAKTVGVSIDETTKLEDIDTLFKVGRGELLRGAGAVSV